MVTSDFDMAIDSKKSRPIIMITIPESKLNPDRSLDEQESASSGLITCFKSSTIQQYPYISDSKNSNSVHEKDGFFFGMQDS